MENLLEISRGKVFSSLPKTQKGCEMIAEHIKVPYLAFAACSNKVFTTNSDPARLFQILVRARAKPADAPGRIYQTNRREDEADEIPESSTYKDPCKNQIPSMIFIFFG